MDFMKYTIIICFAVVASRLILTNDVVLSLETVEIMKDYSLYELPSGWTEIERDKWQGVLELAVSALKFSRQSIHSYSGSYAIVSDQLMPWRDLMKDLVADNASIADSKDVYRHLDLSVDVVSQGKNTYRNVKYLDDSFMSEGSKLEVGNVKTMDTVSIDTPNEHLESQDGMTLASLKELPEYKGVLTNNIARVVPPENNGNASYISALNPYEFYDFKSWGSIDFLLDVLVGNYSKAEQRKAYKILKLFEVKDSKGIQWYRLYEKLKDPNGVAHEMDVFWCESSGFLPVCITCIKAGKIMDEMLQVRWEFLNGIYVPIKVRYYRCCDDGKIDHLRKMEISDVRINEKIEEDVFSQRSLGLPDGGLIVDNIQKKVFAYKNGERVFLADFQEKNISKPDAFVLGKRIWIVLIGFCMICAGFYMRYHGKRKKRSESVE